MAVAYDAVSESHTGTTGASSVATFSWTHTPSGTPKGVLVFVATFVNTGDIITGVTYGGVPMSAVTGGLAADTGGEPGQTKAYFLGSSIPTGAQTVEVSRTNNATATYGCAITVTAASDTSYAGVFIEEQNVAGVVERDIDDGSPGTDSLRFCGLYYGGVSPPTAGANSTRIIEIDLGSYAWSAYVENTAGQGSRPVGVSGPSQDDTAAVYLAIIETGGGGAAGIRNPMFGPLTLRTPLGRAA